ncbi:hypothetical protein [Truepera radiovictrix]|uniref:Uncharacterized protein n=1 Tax=Truepera radiovictrix (strain DSM 17093 / CIP 108686 / LMG 22925 / RQ-24) TaxID=649638 RepID=D7CWU9_TRURR|nr:hypothetical protein [Truepera radiovictrix]ADI14457.1 hypothetical protein Trad_1335 [Truepera radiovictrix DSM 17093]WMT56986.1 hypothetical protein RCV51_13330 [Truepera radiovictrix]
MLALSILSGSLIACSTGVRDDVAPPEVELPASPEPVRTLTTWTIDPDFDVAQLDDPQTRAWYERVYTEIAHERTRRCLPPSATPEDYPHYPASGTLAACSGVKHYVGRGLNFYVTSLLSLFRVTGDAALLQEVDRVMELARAQLADTNGDGYRNWRWLKRIDSSDFNLKEESLAHGFIAQVAYVFTQNAALSTPEHPYAARAALWLEYLRDDFEAKWAQRSATRASRGLPRHSLFHPYMELLRYTVYMAKLFPEDPRYAALRDDMTRTALHEFREDMTEAGPALVWSHRMRWAAEDPEACLVFQMGTYPQQTMLVFADLALEGHAGFADAEKLRALSRTLSESLLEPNRWGFMYKDVGGLRNGSLELPGSRKTAVIDGWCFMESPASIMGREADNFRSEGSYRLLTWGFLAAFAPEPGTPLEATKIYRTNREVYGDPFSAATPRSALHIPVAMAFARLFHAQGYALGAP